MSDAVLETIKLVQEEISLLEAQLLEKKTTVNALCPIAGIDPVYGLEAVTASHSAALNGDEYYAKKASTAIRLVLESRKAQGVGPATLNEIYDGLLAGGYKFDAKNESNSKNSLRVTLSKNSSMFHKLPNKKFGLTKWYNVKPGKKDDSPVAGNSVSDDDDHGIEVMAEQFGNEKPKKEAATN